jgi:hypothetical protein
MHRSVRSRVGRLLSVSPRDLFRPGLANLRVAIFLYGIIGVMLSLWLYVWCVVTCPKEVLEQVSLSSGERVSLLYLHHSGESSWIEYVTNTDGELEAVRAEIRDLLAALHMSPDFPQDSRRLEFHAMRVNLRIWGWYGPFPEVRCCSRTVVVIGPDGRVEQIWEIFARRIGPGVRSV